MTEIETTIEPMAEDEAKGPPEAEEAREAEEAPEAELAQQAEPAPDTEPEPVAEVAPIGEAEPAPEAEPETVAEVEAQVETAPGAGLVAEAELEAAPQPEADQEPGSNGEPDLDAALAEEPAADVDAIAAAVAIEVEIPVPAPAAGRAIGDMLAAAGTKLAFTVPGESFLGLIDGLSGAGIRVIATRHEGAAAFMAEAASQLTGRPQSVLATRAVGASNAAIGIHTARQDSTAMVALIGQVKLGHRGREAFQETDLARTIGGLAAWSAEATSPDDALRLLGEGLARTSRGRPGPILLSLPEDILDQQVSSEAITRASAGGGPAADRTEVRDVLRLLAASRRGLILAGAGVLRARATKRLVALSEALAVPVVASWRRPDVFPNDHPNYLGMTGYWAASTVRQRLLDADALLVLGCRLSEVTSFGYQVPGAGTKWAHVDLEPRGAGSGLAAPDLAFTADAARFLDAAWSDLRSAALDAENRNIREAATAEDRAAYLAASSFEERAWDGPGVSPPHIITTLQRVLPDDALLTSDAGNFGGWLARGFRFRKPGTFLGPTSGAMGYALPAAIAASLLRPDRPAIALCGDGGFSMTMAELETAVRERARPIAIVFDNEAYGTIRMHQQHEGRPIVGTELGAIDFAEVARACGVEGFTVESDDAFEPALRAALEARAPVVIHLRVDRRWVSVDEGP